MSNIMRVSEFAERVGRSANTVRRWEAEGKLSPARNAGGQRYYTEEDVRQVLGQGHIMSAPVKTIVYLRASSPSQKSDLAKQRSAMETFCLNAGLPVDEWVEEIGSGLNFKRKKLLKIIDQSINGQKTTLIVAHKDRLARFGYELIDHIIKTTGGKTIIANQQQLSPTEELVQDILAILPVFSSRLYGLRRYEKKIKKHSTTLTEETNEN